MSQPSFHENFSAADDVKVGSNRSFGFVFTVVFSVVGLYPLWSGGELHIWGLVIAGLIFVSALAAPAILAPLNRIWFKFGMLLHKIVSPLIMGLIFFSCVMPIGLLMRVCGKRPLDLDFDPAATSYWIHRPPPSPEPGSMKRQF